MSGQDFERRRALMVSNQLRPNAVNNSAVVAAMGAVPRERFVASDQAAIAYVDTMMPVGGGRMLNPPIVVGRLLTAAAPDRGDRALVVGAATGYTAAVLAAIGCEVTALEEDATLLERARQALGDTPKVTLVQGPLNAGWAAAAPYTMVVIDGAVERIPDAIVEQLIDGGRLVGAVVDRRVTRLVLGRREGAGFGTTAFTDVEAAPLPGFAPAPAFHF